MKGSSHITVNLVLSPSVGVVWFDISEGSVKGTDVLKVYQDAIEAFLAHKPFCGSQEYDSKKKRAFIVDNAGNHHNGIFGEYFNGDAVQKLFGLHYLPVYSPFLQPVEEVFAIIRFRVFRKLEQSEMHAFSTAAVKRILVEVISELTKDEIMKCYLHTNEFLAVAKAKGHVYSQQHYEKTHLGDEFANNSETTRKVDEVISKYLPDDYSIYTPEQNPQLRAFNEKRINPKTVPAHAHTS